MANPTQITKRHPKEAPPPPRKQRAKRKAPETEPQSDPHAPFHHFHGPLPPGSDESDDLTS